MSARLVELGHFVQLLLTTDKKQRSALFSTLTNQQTDLLAEIFHNLIKVLPLNAPERKRLQRKPYLRTLANTKTSASRRKSVIKKNAKQIGELLLSFGDKLLEVIRLSVL